MMPAHIQSRYDKLDMRIKLIVLENNFRTLSFSTFVSAPMMLTFVRVWRKDNQNTMHEESINLDTFPTDDFITRCALIA